MSRPLPPPPSKVTVFDSQWIRWLSGFYDKSGAQTTAEGFSVAGLPPANKSESNKYTRIIYVYDEAGGAVLAFSDGVNWLRVTDRVIVS